MHMDSFTFLTQPYQPYLNKQKLQRLLQLFNVNTQEYLYENVNVFFSLTKSHGLFN